MRIAVIDLGTNTFNLLIADISAKTFKKVLKTKRPVKLTEAGANNQIIAQKAIKRGINALKNHFNTIEKYNVSKVYAFATSAIREANNGKDFVKLIKLEFNLDVNVISGEQEAMYIYDGVRQAFEINDISQIIFFEIHSIFKLILFHFFKDL